MKKVLTFVAVVAVSLSAVSCANNNAKQIDSLSYAIGADIGLNLSLGMKDFDLDREVVLANIEEFYKSGDVEGKEIKEVREKMMQYQYSLLMPYMFAKRSQDRIASDQPDTLPELPALFNEEFTREAVSAMMGKNMGAAVKGVDAEIKIKDVFRAIDDAANVTEPILIDSLMRMTQEQMNSVFRAHADRVRAKAEAERNLAVVENSKASQKWLSKIEKKDGVQKTESGLLYRIDREGDGAQATLDTDVVLVNYEGKTRDGKVFDSSYERGEPISFPLNGVIKGWTEGMKLVKAGGQITLWIPSELAYGENGAGSDIGPNEALEFKVELLEVNPAE